MLKNLTKREKIVILVSLIALITGVYYFQYYEPLKAEEQILKEEIEGLKFQYSQILSIIKRKLPQLKKSTYNLKEQYQTIIDQFPKEKEISAILLEIEDLANEQGITLEYFSPKNMRSKGDFYELPINISFFSTYREMVGFFYALEKSQRKMEIVSFDVKASTKKSEEQLLQVDLILNIYFLK
ncbi:hypothetical protein BBF96_14590 [Anoxybacter fermentans]|uniref:Pilus assembly protein PilO n=1 Tax=Anoxybacter fermentans TaxID=1323375 RepID=A0A3Q9HS43_9FIRM|nr:type 4a pilus biogenesis protein PilO [Anoxybacter fermentans]AZR74505.1 hypothetical protein BBF96_14590 [Anoxybacter fermentans]